MIKKRKADVIYEPLREELLQLPVGSRTGSIRELMRRYETSQLSVTRALGRLEREGVLERRPDGTLFLRGENPTDRKLLGLLVPDWPSASNRAVEELIRRVGEGRNIQVRRVNYPLSWSFRQLESTGFDAYLLIPERTLTTEDVYYIGLCPIPLLIMGRIFEDIELNYIASSPLQNGIKAASYLYGKGHRKMLLLVSEPPDSVINGRRNGFLTFANAAGCQVEILDCHVEHGESSQGKTRDILSAYLEEKRADFSAIYAVSDGTALSAICTLNEHSFKVPDDISVVGADGGNLGEFFIPSLTTVGADFDCYINRIFDSIEALQEHPEQVVQQVIPSHVIERNSVKDLTDRKD